MLTHPTLNQLKALNLDGMWSGTVVCRRFEDDRIWAATRLPRWNTSTVCAATRTHTRSRSSVYGTE